MWVRSFPIEYIIRPFVNVAFIYVLSYFVRFFKLSMRLVNNIMFVASFVHLSISLIDYRTILFIKIKYLWGARNFATRFSFSA